MNYRGLKDKTFECLACGSEIPFKGYSYNHKYCDNKCQQKHKSDLALEKNKTLFSEGKLVDRAVIYTIIVDRDGNRCSECGITEWNGKPIRLWVDHIDGNAANNTPSNFRLVCPNCDSQSDTFGARNKGNGRKSQGLRQYG